MKKQPTINPNDFVRVESGTEDIYVPLVGDEGFDVEKAIDEINGVVLAGDLEYKVDYLAETKMDIREAIIEKGVMVSEELPFRSYAEKIGDIIGSGGINNEDIEISENGVYTASEGYTGLGTVRVDVVPVVRLQNLNVSENGSYEAEIGYDGLGQVVVDVQPSLQNKTVNRNGTYTADSGYYGLGEVIVNTPVINNQDKTIRHNGTYTADSGYSGLGEVVVDVADIPAVIEPLSVTPTTSAQSISPTGSVEGFAPVNVSAVDASIDANIVAGNIKDGVSILGVNGSVVELNGGTANVSPTTSAQVITPTSPVNGFTRVEVDAVDATIDSNITSGNIVSGVSILGVQGSAIELNGSTETVTPTTSQQVITPTSPSNGLTSVTVNAVTSAIDPNIIAGNIRDGVTILGVTGNIASDGIMFEKDQNNVLKKKAIVMGFLGATDIGNEALYSAYFYSSVSGNVDMSSFTKISGRRACENCFLSSGITSLDMRNVEEITGSGACSEMVEYTPLTSFNLSKLTKIWNGACRYMFGRCEQLIHQSMPLLEEVFGEGCCWGMFNECIRLVDGSLSVKTINGLRACYEMFNGCSAIVGNNLLEDLEQVSGMWACSEMYKNCSIVGDICFYVLNEINGYEAMKGMFENNSGVTGISFPLLNNSSIDTNVTCFDGMCVGCDNVTFHFPSNVQTMVEGLTGYSTTAPFGATAGTVLFDLPPTVELTGASGNKYTRNPKFDTSNALGWKKSDWEYVSGFTTQGLTIPQVGDTINVSGTTDTIQSITYL